MINTHKDKELLEIDAATAWRIGWIDYDESYSFFDPKKNREQAQKDMETLKQKTSGKKSNEMKFKLGKKN